MESICVSLATLYDKFNGNLFNGVIEKSYDGEMEYYDLYVNGQLVCMDGETCKIVQQNDNEVVLLNTEGEMNCTFTLTVKELNETNFYNTAV